MNVHVAPFAQAIAAGVDAVMTAHMVVEAVLTRLLREELGFEGLVVTDALNMAALADFWSQDEIAVMALQAGADVLLMPDNLPVAYEGVLDAVRSGVITRNASKTPSCAFSRPSTTGACSTIRSRTPTLWEPRWATRNTLPQPRKWRGAPPRSWRTAPGTAPRYGRYRKRSGGRAHSGKHLRGGGAAERARPEHTTLQTVSTSPTSAQ
jgi:hypothetical protein